MGFPLKYKKEVTTTNAFHKRLDKSNRKPNKIWIDKSNEFYNRSMKSFLQNNNIEMYLTHNEGKSVIAERFIRTLRNKIINKLLQFQTMCTFVNQVIQSINIIIHVIAQLT